MYVYNDGIVKKLSLKFTEEFEVVVQATELTGET